MAQPWLEQAQALGLGRSAKVAHDCGESPSMHINHKVDGWSAYCHRCGFSGWERKALPTLQERLAVAEAARKADRDTEVAGTLPAPHLWLPEQWPVEARLWLYKAGLRNDQITKLGAYYHPPTRRVVLPVVEAGQIVFWQARRVFEYGPKYLSPVVRRGAVLPRYGSASAVVLCEDILSAFKVGQAAEGWSLMGTTLHTPILSKLVQMNRPVCVWLDNDTDSRRNSGQLAAAEVMTTLESVGLQAYNILTDRDPKTYSVREIKQILFNTGYFNELRCITPSSAEASEGILEVVSHGKRESFGWAHCNYPR